MLICESLSIGAGCIMSSVSKMFSFGSLTIFALFVCNMHAMLPHQNLTKYLEQHRQRRSLIFQDKGSISINIGPAINVGLGDSVPWRSLVYIFNLHCGTYPLPTTPTYPWDKWEDLYARDLRQKVIYLDKTRADDGRLFVYAALENYVNSQAQSSTLGRQCLLRGICENAQVEHHAGMYAEILNIVLTPGVTSLHQDYRDAERAGKSGIDCLTLYTECPKGRWILDEYLDEFL